MCQPDKCTHPCPKHPPRPDSRITPVDCVCDHGHAALLDRMATGIGQRAASLQLWAPEELEEAS